MYSYQGLVAYGCQYYNTNTVSKNFAFLAQKLQLHTPSALRHQRHRWTEEEDRVIVQVVREKGNVWREIADRLGIKGSSLKVKRRWETIQPKCKSSWIKGEDEDLERAVNKYVAEYGGILGERGSWKAIANMLKTDRTPRQCFTRWNKSLLPRQGVAMAFTRFENVRGWKWRECETARLYTAIASVTSTAGSDKEVERAECDEPWLLKTHETEARLTPQYWVYVASKVGTRSASQCMARWKWIKDSIKSPNMELSEVKHLIQLVKMHGTQWSFLGSKYFPNREPRELMYMYRLWKRAESELGTGFIDIDPLSMLREFKGIRALRHTGEDGNYDPNGEPIMVSVSNKPSIFTPYYLALRNVSKLKIKKSIGSHGGGGVSRAQRRGTPPPDIIERLFKAISEHKNDWVSISRDVGVSIKQCRRYAQVLGSSMASIREATTNLELDRLLERAKHSIYTPNKRDSSS